MHIGGLDLHVQDHGEGPPVLLLHGWPDSSYLWRNQIPALNEAGFRAMAPDMRGFGESERPVEVADYSIRSLRSDVIGILDELSLDRVHVVGHDWGAALAWNLAINHPDRIDRMIVISAPHSDVPDNVEQYEKFWYQLLFQFEGVAEAILEHDNWSLFRQILRNDGDIDRYLVDLARPGALTASLNVYRANAAPMPPGPPREPRRVTTPTLVIWPSGDQFLVEERLIASTELVDAPSRYVRLDDSSHWAPLDAPARLNQLILDWLEISL